MQRDRLIRELDGRPPVGISEIRPLVGVVGPN
jgi:hypothetical protein